jgi:hypothetical protein
MTSLFGDRRCHLEIEITAQNSRFPVRELDQQRQRAGPYADVANPMRLPLPAFWMVNILFPSGGSRNNSALNDI